MVTVLVVVVLWGFVDFFYGFLILYKCVIITIYFVIFVWF